MVTAADNRAIQSEKLPFMLAGNCKFLWKGGPHLYGVIKEAVTLMNHLKDSVLWEKIGNNPYCERGNKQKIFW